MSKRTRRTYTAEAVSNLFNLPLDAIITGMEWDHEFNRLDIYYNASSAPDMHETYSVFTAGYFEARDIERRIEPLNA